MLRLDGFWYLAVMERWGNGEAFDCDVRVWEKARPYEVQTISGPLNIRGDDVATVMKYIQVCPWMRIYDLDIDLKTNDHAIVTYRHCPTLLALEKEGKGRERLICRGLEPNVFDTTAHYFNPNIKVTGLRVPPRTGYDGICCQWEYRLDR